ncbi:recombinase family protein [Microbacterium sp. VKM Ac-2870]|uniref:recombinase family protein n=1 Tax=Microbacterium sp. VKM Ac-2870 TaxID=2783825 RepID=UPI00188B9FFD|nr:recombinase family protein [Microbacterium sp. VKM Ac-2870]MBF4561192.1 recombinase family protein [Microbacterium sp. VKM Ac-2870]
MSDNPKLTAPSTRRRTSFSGWEQLLGLDGVAPPSSELGLGGQAVIYLRVSTPRQMLTAIDIDADGNSIATQREACMVRAKRAKAPVVREFVEPGNSAQTIAKRPVFREMLHYIEEHPEVTCVVIYMRSRAFRNLADAAITKRILASMGVKLISAKEDFGEGYMADAMEAVTDIMNEVQVRQSGEDIKQKLLNKAKNGGTVGRAKLGYINDRKNFDGRLVNTISVDEERAPLITWAFDQYATGEYSVWQLAQALDGLGLKTRASHKRPAQPVSASALAKILRDPYYTGVVPFKGQVYPGRHEAIVDNETFEACQEILDRRNRKGDRDFVHFHYLKGLLMCGQCESEGRRRRLVYMQTTGNGGTYEYWVCSGKQRDGCRLGTIRMDDVEAAVAQRAALEKLTDEEASTLHSALDDTLRNSQAAQIQARTALSRELKKLEAQEERLIDLAADGSLAPDKVRERLSRVTLRKKTTIDKLAQTESRIEQGGDIVRAYLDLLAGPARFYRDTHDNVRRQILGALFSELVVYREDDIVGVSAHRTEINEALQQLRHHAGRDADPVMTETKRTSRISAGGSPSTSMRLNLSNGLNILNMVGMTGFEPATP